MARAMWNIETVMDYFGELFSSDDESQAYAMEYLEELALQVEGEMYHKTLFTRMHRLRELLIEAGYEVPFRAVYHRKGGRDERR